MSAWDSDAGLGLRPGFSSSPPAAIMWARQVEMAGGVDAEARLELSMHCRGWALCANDEDRTAAAVYFDFRLILLNPPYKAATEW
jgi:hypothetical protein